MVANVFLYCEYEMNRRLIWLSISCYEEHAQDWYFAEDSKIMIAVILL